MTNQIVAFDTETYLFANGSKAPKVVCLQVDDGISTEIIVGHDAIVNHAWVLFRRVANYELLLVGQNTAYDMGVLAAADPRLMQAIFAAYDAGRVQCTRIRERLLDIAKGRTGPQTRQRGYYSMDALAIRRHLPINVDKNNPWRMRYAELDGVPVEQWPKEAYQYALDDPKATRLLYLSQASDAEGMPYPGFEEEAARQAGFDFALHLMGCWGVRTSQERVKALLERTDTRLGELEPQLREAGILSVKGAKSTKAIRDRVEAAFNAAGIQPPKTEKGAIKTDKDTIEKCSNNPELQMVVEHAYLTKLRSTYVLKLIEGINGNIHTSFHVLGADTGRTSSSQPNLQNQSKKGGVRECFVAREGCVFIGADYDAQELRTLAQACLDICGHSRLAKRFQEDPDYDPHTDFACNVMGWNYAEALIRLAEGDVEVEDRRQQAKAGNFGFPGGLGAKSFVSYARGYGVNINLDQSEQLKKQWFDHLPEMADYFKHVKWIEESGKLVQLRSGRIRGGVGFCDSANSFFQGLASEASKTAVYLVSKACYTDTCSPLYGCRPVMLVHDEIIVEAPESYAHEAAMELQRLMVLAMEMWCPDVPARATPVASRCWSKKAKPIYKKGRLVPWDVPEEKTASA